MSEHMPKQHSPIFNALTIAGSDSSGGAGIQADLKAFSAMGVYGASVITALTAQNTRAVTDVFPCTPDFLLAQLEAVFSDLEIHAVKTGMLGDAAMVAAVAGFLKEQPALKLVVDPVMISKSGNALLAPEAVATLIEQLLPLAYLVTPNLPEAAAMLDCPEPTNLDEMKEIAARLQALGPAHVLLKGGHLQGRESPDVLFDGTSYWTFPSPRFNTKNTHGTGCTLASAITAGLARGERVQEAVAQAKSYIVAAIQHADQLNVGSGHGPVNHFYRFWS